MTVKTALCVPASPSVTVTSSISSVGAASSSVIVPVPIAVPSVAFCTPLSSTVNVSAVPSSSRSPRTGTEIVCVNAPPGVNVSVPDVAV